MRPNRPESRPSEARGLTLIELVVAMVLVAIIIGATIYFVYPLRQAVDVTTRAELTDAADNALQRIGREVRLALPNSVRVDATRRYLEFIPVRDAGRYRADGGGPSSGANCGDTGVGVPASDQLSFDVVDTCFKTIGSLSNAASITANDWVVLNNYGPGFAGQDAYAVAGTLNRRRIAAAVVDGTRERISITSATAFDRTLHDSPGRRFYIANGTAAGLPEPVTYDCSGGALIRRWGYQMTAAQPVLLASFVGGTSQSIANNVADCTFEYVPNAGPQIGLLTLRLTLSKARSDGGNESVFLYQSVHVSNLP
jgi:MSHA biogenesis protein MshO